MNSPFRILPFFLFILVVASCNRGATDFVFPTPVDTSTRAISLQDKRSYDFPTEGLSFDNQFDGARLNGVEQLTATSYVVSIEPENEPINPSPWYAFRLRSEKDQEIFVRIAYPNGANHRYYPKLSKDRRSWVSVDSSTIINHSDKEEITVALSISAGETLYVAGQEVINSSDVGEWLTELANKHDINVTTIGESRLGRDLRRFAITDGALNARPTIVLLSRQHPPEVTGFLAFQAFIDGLLEDPRLPELLKKYQFLVYPLLNPDGVDLGHWRHSAGGIDSNRDWATYNQPEARQVADNVVRTVRKAGSKVVLGMDFHSTWHDVFYTHDDSVQPPSALPDFTKAWLAGIEKAIGGDFKVNEDAKGIGKPTTASWFRTQFGAEGITYEIGDDTDRDFVARKGQVSAQQLIEVLLSSK
ncbi:MAG: M14 family metallopeptidase [Bacteroidota bacterium]